MKRLCLFLPLLALGCGPSASDFAGSYDVTATESLTECDGSGSPTDMALVTSVSIREGSAADLQVTAGRCTFDATIGEEVDGALTFSVPTQSCTVSIDEPAVVIKVSGEGTLLEGILSLTLSGTYETSTYGIPIECSYALTLAGG